MPPCAWHVLLHSFSYWGLLARLVFRRKSAKYEWGHQTCSHFTFSTALLTALFRMVWIHTLLLEYSPHFFLLHALSPAGNFLPYFPFFPHRICCFYCTHACLMPAWLRTTGVTTSTFKGIDVVLMRTWLHSNKLLTLLLLFRLQWPFLLQKWTKL